MSCAVFDTLYHVKRRGRVTVVGEEAVNQYTFMPKPRPEDIKAYTRAYGSLQNDNFEPYENRVISDSLIMSIAGNSVIVRLSNTYVAIEITASLFNDFVKEVTIENGVIRSPHRLSMQLDGVGLVAINGPTYRAALKTTGTEDLEGDIEWGNIKIGDRVVMRDREVHIYLGYYDYIALDMNNNIAGPVGNTMKMHWTIHEEALQHPEIDLSSNPVAILDVTKVVRANDFSEEEGFLVAFNTSNFSSFIPVKDGYKLTEQTVNCTKEILNNFSGRHPIRYSLGKDNKLIKAQMMDKRPVLGDTYTTVFVTTSGLDRPLRN